ncbi:hypothetical protein [Rathayibacter rathayi]|uniref:hypothetical protein n=1 Tax=Rathayibacter rathayi TaxID=33887 RepID=UPI000CE74A80|nr:hypothetical protein [Rathayibacter rathayi]PPG15002.1 hypothetical protein C5C11_03630 [Rathayibacter rathayi]
MTFVISTDPTEIPSRSDGSPYPATLLASFGSALFADTLTELVEQIIPDYGSLPTDDPIEDPSLEARLTSLASFANTAQAGAVAALQESDVFDISAVGEDALTALFSPKDGPVLEFERWDSGIPLILFATNYAPYTPVAPPFGEAIVWVNAHTELDFLNSLEPLGIAELHLLADGDDSEG